MKASGPPPIEEETPLKVQGAKRGGSVSRAPALDGPPQDGSTPFIVLPSTQTPLKQGWLISTIAPALAVLAVSVVKASCPQSVALGALAVLLSIPGFMSMSEHAERFRAIRADRMVVGQLLDAALPADAVIAIHSAGIVPFYARRTTVDMWGINDAHIARAAVEMGEGTAGHERHDYAYVLSREPDVILPERGLVTDARRDLGDPGVFGEGFAERYQSVSVPLSEGVVNLWRRRE